MKETPRRIRTERTRSAFYCKTQFAPAEVHRTPDQAWQAFWQRCDSEIRDLTDRLEYLRAARAHAAKVIASGDLGEGCADVL